MQGLTHASRWCADSLRVMGLRPSAGSPAGLGEPGRLPADASSPSSSSLSKHIQHWRASSSAGDSGPPDGDVSRGTSSDVSRASALLGGPWTPSGGSAAVLITQEEPAAPIGKGIFGRWAPVTDTVARPSIDHLTAPRAGPLHATITTRWISRISGFRAQGLSRLKPGRQSPSRS